MIEKKDKEEKHDKQFANPAKFGLVGFAIALFMLGLNYANVFPLNTVVLATVLTMGVIAPLLAGILEFVKGNSYRATGFILISLFFLTFFMFVTQTLAGVGLPADKNTLGAFYLIWSLILAMLLYGTITNKRLEMNAKAIMFQIILASFLLFTLLASIAQFTQMNAIFIAAGVFALICSVAILADFCMHACHRMKRD
jgi:hypothetical protein